MKCRLSTFVPIHQKVIVIRAKDRRRDINRFQTGFLLPSNILLSFTKRIEPAAPRQLIILTY